MRRSERRHYNRFQLDDRFRELQRDYLNRSTLGYIAVFNMPPDAVFGGCYVGEFITVKEFQHNLMVFLRAAIAHNDWMNLLSPRIALSNHPLLSAQSIMF